MLRAAPGRALLLWEWKRTGTHVGDPEQHVSVKGKVCLCRLLQNCYVPGHLRELRESFLTLHKAKCI